MKAWIIAIAIILVVLVGAGVYSTFNLANSPLEARENEALRLAQASYEIDEVTDIVFYHGTTPYQVIDAVVAGEPTYIWVEELIDETDEDIEIQDNMDNEVSNEVEEANEEASLEEAEQREPTIFAFAHADGLTAEEALERVDADIMEVRSVKLGAISSVPIYEIHYEDSQNRLGYYFIDFESGDYLRQYQLSKNPS
ncbi:hypothetical protein FLK61_30905 [Paenalkalicoccus suaedae]|uniref:DUF5590 domain-containing protein n=1 Tax=Paenalkalicoccus suaedae TaxID=2592382 RepID=A0A859FDG9_9BACI|nr:hypothetical protein [Paenalkalicoccus suaedae]QKS71127.1 hypothetical protein FLK61_30905 [Paenalkalicoccus suaedae]